MYNGWANYETWIVNLWIESDECLCSFLHDSLRQHVGETFSDCAAAANRHAAIFATARELQDRVSGAMPSLRESSLQGDLLRSAIGNVDWHALVSNWFDDLIGVE